VPSRRRLCGLCQSDDGDFVSGDLKDAAEAACVETGLESLLVLADMDRQKREARTDRWRPSIWKHSV
jgi:hypothetical protein